jgi:hypothetical protein
MDTRITAHVTEVVRAWTGVITALVVYAAAVAVRLNARKVHTRRGRAGPLLHAKTGDAKTTILDILMYAGPFLAQIFGARVEIIAVFFDLTAAGIALNLTGPRSSRTARIVARSGAGAVEVCSTAALN